MEIRTIDDISLGSCGVRVVLICTEEGNKRIDAIQALGTIEITPTGKVQLGRKRESCAAITIKKPDFCAIFNHKEKAWTARWKGTRNEVPDQLHNVITVYTVSDEKRATYKEELWTWIENG